MNYCIFSGRFTRDPELKETASGVQFVNFTIAVDASRKDKDGNKRTDFLDFVAWQKRADFIAKHFQKGDGCVIAAEAKKTSWKDQNGESHSNTEFVVDEIEFPLNEPKSRKQESDQALDQIEEKMRELGFAPANDPDDGLPF